LAQNRQNARKNARVIKLPDTWFEIFQTPEKPCCYRQSVKLFKKNHKLCRVQFSRQCGNVAAIIKNHCRAPVSHAEYRFKQSGINGSKNLTRQWCGNQDLK